jgi:hypothetical protein
VIVRGVCASLPLFGLTLIASPALAQSPPAAPTTIALGDWQLTPLAELRTRGEYWHAPVDVGGGQGFAAAPVITDAGGVLERSRLGLGAERGPLKAQLTLQDARAWGSTPAVALLNAPQTAPASFGLFEGYVEAHTNAARPSFVRLGRQVVQWGEGRLLGAADWSPVGRSLDAIRGRLGVAGGALELEALAAILDSPRPLGNGVLDPAVGATGGVQLYGASATYSFDPIFRAQVYGLVKVARAGSGATVDPRSFAEASTEGEVYTGALHLFGERDGWKWGAEGAYQIGRVPSFTDTQSRQAFAVAASVTKTFEHAVMVPVVRLAGSYASGDDGQGTYKQFDPILPDVHVFYGAMDIFTFSNILEANVRATIAPTGDTTASLEYRWAELAQAKGEWLNAYLTPVGRAPQNTAQDLGHEIDAWFTYTPWAPLDLVAGYSVLIVGDGAKTILAAEGRGSQNGTTFSPEDLAHYAYLQATLRVP